MERHRSFGRTSPATSSKSPRFFGSVIRTRGAAKTGRRGVGNTLTAPDSPRPMSWWRPWMEKWWPASIARCCRCSSNHGLTVRASFDGDFAVLPEHRGRDLSAQVYDITDPRLLKRGVIFRGGFTSRELNERFYGKRFGYLFVPEAQITFRKIIGLAPLQEKLATLGQRLLARPRLRHVLRDRPFVVNMLVEGFPPAHVEMTAKGFSLRGGHVVAPDLRVRMPYNALLGFVAGPRLLLQHAVAALLTGRFWVAGLTRSGTRLIAIWWALIRRS